MYERLQLSTPLRAFVEYGIQSPGDFFANLGRKALYSLGLFDVSGIEPMGAAVPGISLLYVGVWCSALIGIIRLARAPTHRQWAVVALPGLAACSHFLTVVLFFPNSYGDRLILPLYPLLIPYAAFGLEPAVLWAERHQKRVTLWSIGALALAIFFPPSSRASDAVMLLIILAGLVAISTAPAPISRFERWSYAGYVGMFVALALRASGGMGDEFTLGRYLLLPVALFAVSQAGRHDAVQRTTLAALCVGPFLSSEAAARVTANRLADPVILLVAAIALMSLSVLTVSRVVRRTTTILGTGCVIVALVLPFLPGINEDVTDQVGDIRRDITSMAGGNEEAQQALVDDVKAVASEVLDPFVVVWAVVTGHTKVFSIACLFALLVLAISLAYGVSLKYRWPITVSGALLVTAYVAALIGSRPEIWSANGYSLASLAILSGLVHARWTRHLAPARISSDLAEC